MTSISDVIIMCLEFARNTYWEFNLFGQHWQLTFLQMWILPCIAFITIRIVKHIYEVVNM